MVAYALSRVNHLPSLMALSLPTGVQLEQLNREVEANDRLRKILAELLYRGSLVLPKRSTLIQLIMQEEHHGSLGGGVFGIFENIEVDFHECILDGNEEGYSPLCQELCCLSTE